jgi:hypothetical protein
MRSKAGAAQDDTTHWMLKPTEQPVRELRLAGDEWRQTGRWAA